MSVEVFKSRIWHTRRSPVNVIVGTTAVQVFAPNPFRKAMIFNPLAGNNGNTTPFVAQAFIAGTGQTFTVPNGVTQILDIFGWGAGGNPGAAGATNGGGGGGGGAFCTAGPLTAVPGSIYAIGVDTGGGASATTVVAPDGTTLINAGSGANGVTSTKGGGGAATTGKIKQVGGGGANGAAPIGGGGGGAGGYSAVGGAAVGSTGGTGGGAAVYSTYGKGGNGGAGGNANVNGGPGTSPGGGGGGGGSTAGGAGIPSDGLVVVFYEPSIFAQSLSLGPDQNVVAGQGFINITPQTTYPIILTDEEIGNAITEPLFAISGVAGIVLSALEFFYDRNETEPAF